MKGKQSSKSNGTNVNTLLTGLAALVSTVVLYVVLFLPLQNTRFGALFAQRGWVPYVIVMLAAWSIWILLAKRVKLRKQRTYLDSDVLPVGLSEKITSENADTFCDHIRHLTTRLADHILLRRVVTALEHFKSRPEVKEIADLLESQANIDAASIESSYGLLKVFIWAIPILGFIGTVLGIGQAVQGFSESIGAAQELDVIKTDLGMVTTGLAVAFDTTLVALIVSILIMFPTSALQRAEEALLNRVDEYCNENLLRRMDDESSIPGEPEAIKQAIGEAFSEHKAKLDSWVLNLQEVGSRLREQMVSGWQEVDSRMQEAQKQQLKQVEGIYGAIAERHTSFVAELERVQNLQGQQLSNLMSTMGETTEQVQRQIVELQESQVHNSQDIISALARNLESLQQAAQERYQSEASELKTAAERFLQTLSGLEDQIRSTQHEMAGSLRDTHLVVREEFGRLVTEVGENFRSQINSTEKMQKSIEDSAQKVMAHMEDSRSIHSEQMTDAASAFRDAIRSLLQQSAKNQDEYLDHLRQILASVAEDMGVTQREIASARQTQTATINVAQQQLEQTQKDIRQSAREQVEHLSATSEKIVASLGPSIQNIFKTERQEAAKSTAVHLAKVSKVGNEFASRLVRSQKKLDEHITTFIRIIEGQQKLTAMQQILASNLELLTTSDSFKQTLAGINRSLNRLHDVLESVSERAGIIWPEGTAIAPQANGFSRRILRRFKRRGTNA